MIELARCPSPYGAIRILERESDGARLYNQAGALQTLAYPDGTSLFGYAHAIEILVRDRQRILILGGAGGSLATMLARRGCIATVVDIDPQSEQLARSFFGLDPRVRWVTADAMQYINASAATFDAIVVDAFDAHGLARAFTQADGVETAARILAEDGRIVVNLAGFDGPLDFAWPLACTLAQKGWHATLFRATDGWEGNELLWASRAEHAVPLDIADLMDRPAETRTYLMSLKPFVAPDAPP
jgi:predicted membrane-bound spermidine synthase